MPEQNFPATRIVHWPTGPVDVCDEHVIQLLNIAHVMGIHCITTEAVMESQCTNCINENKKARP